MLRDISRHPKSLGLANQPCVLPHPFSVQSIHFCSNSRSIVPMHTCAPGLPGRNNLVLVFAGSGFKQSSTTPWGLSGINKLKNNLGFSVIPAIIPYRGCCIEARVSSREITVPT